MRDSAVSLMQIVNNMLDFSNIEAGRLDLDRAAIDLRACVELVINSLMQAAHDKAVALRLEIDPRLAAEHYSDGVRLRQILFNLLSNAIKFTHGGEVALRVNVAQHTNSAQRVQFCVEDTGIGIWKEDQERLCQPFVCVDSSTTRGLRGAGLGLAITRRLAELLQGALTMTSAPGEGTQMTFAAQFDVATPRAVDPALSGKRIVTLLDASLAETVSRHVAALGLQELSIGTANSSAQQLVDSAGSLRAHAVLVSKETLRARYGMAPLEFAQRANVHPTRMIVMSSAAGSGGESYAPVFSAISCNPLLPSALDLAIGVALGLKTREPRAQAPGEALARRHTPPREQAIQEGTLVLVAEDNPTNQILIREQLEMLGYAVDICEDGGQALAAWQNGRYGLMLVDCQMPIVDGYELARRVRQLERVGTARTPIIALTANALVGESAKCLAAGMDDYLVKPVGLAVLDEKLEYWLPRRRATSAERAMPAQEPTLRLGADEIIDLRGLYETLGDVRALRRALQSYVSEAERDHALLRAAVGGRDADAVECLAHRMRGAALLVGAAPLSELSRRLELAARANHWTEVESALAELEVASAAVRAAIARRVDAPEEQRP